MKHNKRVIAAILAVLMAAGCVFMLPGPDARAITKATIDNLKEQAKDVQNEINKYYARIEELELEGKKTFAQKELYDEQCRLMEEQIALTEEEIAYYEELVEEARREYDDAVAAEEAQYELMCERIRSMEERGTISYMEIVFAASSFADLLGRIDFIDEVMQSDEDVITGWQEKQAETLIRQQELYDTIEETEAVKADLEAQKVELEAMRDAAEALMAEIQANTEEYEKLVAAREAEEAALKEQIKKAEAEYAEQIRKEREAAAAAAANSGSSSGSASGSGNSANGVSLAWPVGSRNVTSGFGPRSSSSTNGVGSTYHMGIDIGSVGYTTPVGAAAAGVVTVATRSSSAGNYVAVSHGDGVTTLYMHLSSISVSVGDSVSQGTTLGITGSTGNSTGPHLHFAVQINGSYVNPMNYLP